MGAKCVVADTNIIEIDRERYDELISKESQLHLLKRVVADLPDEYNTELKAIKKIFCLGKEETKNED